MYVILPYTLQAPALEEGRMLRSTFFPLPLKETRMVFSVNRQKGCGSAVARVASFRTQFIRTVSVEMLTALHLPNKNTLLIVIPALQ